jgi:hypothetical protein
MSISPRVSADDLRSTYTWMSGSLDRNGRAWTFRSRAWRNVADSHGGIWIRQERPRLSGSTGGDAVQRQRLLEYNEDDCRAMRVVMEALKGMPVRTV